MHSVMYIHWNGVVVVDVATAGVVVDGTRAPLTKVMRSDS
jgi:hypothetical protein